MTSDPNAVGTYELDLLVTPNGPNSAGTLVVPYNLKITGCIYDQVQLLSPIGQVVYQVQGGPDTVSATFGTRYQADCPAELSYSLK